MTTTPTSRPTAGRSPSSAPAGANDDVFSVRPSGARLARLTRTGGVDEFEPRYFAGGILFSRGDSSDTPAAYADVYTMRANGTKVKPQVRGVGSAYVEDVTGNGHTLLFRRDQGLWVKRIGPSKARKLCQLPGRLGDQRRLLLRRPPRRRLRRRRRTRAAGRDRRRQRSPARPRRRGRPDRRRRHHDRAGHLLAARSLRQRRIPGERPKPPESDPARIRSRWQRSPSAPRLPATASTR